MTCSIPFADGWGKTDRGGPTKLFYAPSTRRARLEGYDDVSSGIDDRFQDSIGLLQRIGAKSRHHG